MWTVLQGVVKALREQNLLPRIVAGSSVGSIGERSSSQSSEYCPRWGSCACHVDCKSTEEGLKWSSGCMYSGGVCGHPQ